MGPRAIAPQGRAENRRPCGGEGHRLHLQGPGQHGSQSSRPDRIHAPVLGAFPARHEAAVVAVRWIETDNARTLRRFVERHRGRVAKDRDEALVYLPESQWALEQTAKDWPDLSFVSVRERG